MNWMIAPTVYADLGRRADNYHRVWSLCATRDIITVGWDNLGRAPTSSVDLMNMWRERPDTTWTPHGYRQLYAFYFRISEGDAVVARAGRSRVVGVGTVRGRLYYDQTAWEDGLFANILPIQWSFNGSLVVPFILPRQTITPLKDDHLEIIGGLVQRSIQ